MCPFFAVHVKLQFFCLYSPFLHFAKAVRFRLFPEPDTGNLTSSDTRVPEIGHLRIPGYPKLDIFGYPGTRKQFCKNMLYSQMYKK